MCVQIYSLCSPDTNTTIVELQTVFIFGERGVVLRALKIFLEFVGKESGSFTYFKLLAVLLSKVTLCFEPNLRVQFPNQLKECPLGVQWGSAPACQNGKGPSPALLECLYFQAPFSVSYLSLFHLTKSNEMGIIYPVYRWKLKLTCLNYPVNSIHQTTDSGLVFQTLP